jgi:hypothetical protein
MGPINHGYVGIECYCTHIQFLNSAFNAYRMQHKLLNTKLLNQETMVVVRNQQMDTRESVFRIRSALISIISTPWIQIRMPETKPVRI